MSQCCSTTQNKHPCPKDQTPGHEVAITTILHHLKTPWSWQPNGQHYYFCDNAACDVIYYSDSGDLIQQQQLRSDVGIKSDRPDALICHCYGVSREQSNNPEIKQFVVEQTKLGNCACEIRNPAGRCCLKDFPKSRTITD